MTVESGKRIADVVIVAAGRGTRAGDGPPKQYRPIEGKPLLARTIEAAAASESVARIQVVIGADAGEDYAAAITHILPSATAKLLPSATGAATRAESVRAGLEALAQHGPPARVLIHDAARPFASAQLFDRVAAALEHAPGACAGLRVVDALRREDGMRRVAAGRWSRVMVYGGRRRLKASTLMRSSPRIGRSPTPRLRMTPRSPCRPGCRWLWSRESRKTSR